GLTVELSGLPPGVHSKQESIDPRTGKSRWVLAVDKTVPAGEKELTVTASAGEARAEGKLRLLVTERTVGRPPDPAPGGQPQMVARLGVSEPCFGGSFSPDGSKALAYTRPWIYVLDAKSGAVLHRISCRRYHVHGVAWVDNAQILRASDGMPLHFYNPDARGTKYHFEGDTKRSSALALAPDRTLAAAVTDGALRVF